jgi:hypothetical protein
MEKIIFLYALNIGAVLREKCNFCKRKDGNVLAIDDVLNILQRLEVL